MMNRLANCTNPYQSIRKKVLCVCSAGLLRSPTTAWILSNEPFDFNTRACGADVDFALIPIDPVLVMWADEVVCMNKYQAEQVREFKQLGDKQVHVLDVPDTFEFRDPELVKIITKKCEEVFNRKAD